MIAALREGAVRYLTSNSYSQRQVPSEAEAEPKITFRLADAKETGLLHLNHYKKKKGWKHSQVIVLLEAIRRSMRPVTLTQSICRLYGKQMRILTSAQTTMSQSRCPAVYLTCTYRILHHPTHRHLHLNLTKP